MLCLYLSTTVLQSAPMTLHVNDLNREVRNLIVQVSDPLKEMFAVRRDGDIAPCLTCLVWDMDVDWVHQMPSVVDGSDRLVEVRVRNDEILVLVDSRLNLLTCTQSQIAHATNSLDFLI